MQALTSTTDTERSFLPFEHDGKDEVVLMVNNLGGVSELEMGGVAGKGKVGCEPTCAWTLAEVY